MKTRKGSTRTNVVPKGKSSSKSKITTTTSTTTTSYWEPVDSLQHIYPIFPEYEESDTPGCIFLVIFIFIAIVLIFKIFV